MHIISTEFDHNNISGKNSGKGIIKLRVDQRQEEVITKRMDKTPNMTTKRVEDGNFNKQTN